MIKRFPNVKSPQWYKERNKRITEMYATKCSECGSRKYSLRQLGKEFNLHHSTIAYLLKMH